VIAKYALALLCCGWLFVGCKFDDHRKLCRDDSDCLNGSGRCYDGFCIKRSPTSMNEIPVVAVVPVASTRAARAESMPAT